MGMIKIHKKNLPGKIFLFIAAVFLSAILLEFALRLFYPQLTLERGEQLSVQIYEKSTYTPWRHKPNSAGRMVSPYGKEYDVPVKINSYGLRGDDFSMAKGKNSHRLLFLGDSFTFGAGVKLEDTYSKKLEALLNKGKSGSYRYESINAGFGDGGYTTDVQYLYLREKGLKFKPDTVVVGVFIGNDISDMSKNVWLRNDSNGLPTNITSNYQYVDEKNRLRIHYTNESYYKKYGVFGKIDYILSKKSHLSVFLKNFVIKNTYKPEKIFLQQIPDDSMKNINKMKILMAEMKKVSNQNNADFIVVLIPPRAQVWDYEWKRYRNIYRELGTSRTMPQQLFMDFCESHNITCIDLLPEFQKNASRGGLYFPVDGHWNEGGHELAADVIYQNLMSRKILEKI